jgi:TRAP-type C4-dicarboxylate transport system substrate-binding protein
MVTTSLTSLTAVERQYAEEDSAIAQQKMQKEGIQIISLTPAQRQAFVDQAQPPVIKAIKGSLGEQKVDTWLHDAQAQ